MEKEKLLRLMRYWLFGTFVIVFAAIVTFVGLFTDRNWALALSASLPIWGVTAVLCIAAYFGYKWLLDRKEKQVK
jgi:hypothetical protein